MTTKAERRKNLQRKQQKVREEAARTAEQFDPHAVEGRRPVGSEAQAADVKNVKREARKQWKRPSTLETPPARTGKVQRWIRVALNRATGEPDPNNVAMRMREGWTPRKAETVPEGYSPQTARVSQFEGTVICAGDLILMEMDEEMAAQRDDYYWERLERQNAGIDAQLQELGDGRIVKTAKTRVTRGRYPKAMS